MRRLTLTEILPSSLGKCAARNQSPGNGLVTLNAPVVRFGRVHVRVTAKDPGTTVSRGKRVYRGLITGGAPDLKYLLITKPKNSIPVRPPNIYTNSKSICQHGRRWPFCRYIEKLKIISKPTHCEGDKSPTCSSHVRPTWDSF